MSQGSPSQFRGTPAASQPEAAYTPSAEEAELIRLSQEWMDVALVEKNESKLRKLMAEEFTLQIWDGSRAPQSLDAWMQTLLHRLDKINFRYSGLSARVFGDVGFVYCRFHWTGTMDGRPFEDSGFMADFWRRNSGVWQVVARRSAPQQQIHELANNPLR